MLQVRWNIGKPIKQKDKKRRAAVFNPIANKLASHRDFDLHAEEIGTVSQMTMVPSEMPKPPQPPPKPTPSTSLNPKKFDPKAALELLMPDMAKMSSSASLATSDTTLSSSSAEPAYAADDIDLLDEIDLHEIAQEEFEADLLEPPAKSMRLNRQRDPLAEIAHEAADFLALPAEAMDEDRELDALDYIASEGSTIAAEDAIELALADFPAPVSVPSDARKRVAALAYGLPDALLSLHTLQPIFTTEVQMLGMSRDFKLQPVLDALPVPPRPPSAPPTLVPVPTSDLDLAPFLPAVPDADLSGADFLLQDADDFFLCDM